MLILLRFMHVPLIMFSIPHSGKFSRDSIFTDARTHAYYVLYKQDKCVGWSSEVRKKKKKKNTKLDPSKISCYTVFSLQYHSPCITIISLSVTLL